ncbi:AIR synthase-related protein, partial [Escherichia coli]
WGAQTLTAGDVLLVSGTLGDHGATILNLREQLGLDGELVSDCAVLTPLIQTLRDIPGVKALRDATRGGVNAVVHEFAAACGCGIEISEAALPVKPAVRGVCELLGLDALNFANEGKLVIAVERNAAEQVLAALHSHPLGKDAALIGEVVERKGVRLAGLYGVKRTLDLPHAEPLPQVENQYRRVVPDAGNLLAQQAIADVFCVNGDSEWRGLGVIESSGVHLTPDYQRFDAEAHFRPAPQQVCDDPRARCGEVLTGKCKPHQCPLFGNTCNPQTAFGALMVSSEGACAAWYQYRQQESEA